MTKVTANDLMAMLNNKGVDLNDPLTFLNLAILAEGRMLILSKLSDPLFGCRSERTDAELSLVFGDDKTLGYVLSHTKKEVSEKLHPNTMKRFMILVERYGYTFGEGCCYCGSSKCVAYTHGESVCG